jgi:hypothetical protein
MAEAAPMTTQTTFYICRDEGRDPETATECNALVDAVVALSTLWKRDRQVFSVDVMRAVGAVIAATDAIFEVE